MMTGLHDCTRCGKKLTSRQSLWNHNQRCKLDGKSGSGLMYDYDTKTKLRDLMKTADPEISIERPSLGKRDSCDESFLVSSTGEGFECKEPIEDNEETDVMLAMVEAKPVMMKTIVMKMMKTIHVRVFGRYCWKN